MSDQKLRELERRWKETGSPDDEAAYLLERVRVGDLTQERLELAAYCGHEGARRVSGESEPPAEFFEWIRGLVIRGVEPTCRALLVTGRLLLPFCGPAVGDVEHALDLLEKWIVSPTEEHAEEAFAAGIFASEQVPPFPSQELRQAIWTAGAIPAIPAGVLRGNTTWRRQVTDALSRAMEVLATEELRHACEESLTAWALNSPTEARQ